MMKASPQALRGAVSVLICIAVTAILVDHTMAQTAGSTAYQYDSVGRIVQEVNPNNAASYTYDAAGNRTTTTIGAGNPATATAGTSLSLPRIPSSSPRPSAGSSPLQ
jgi:YD repeat-containing protein